MTDNVVKLDTPYYGRIEPRVVLSKAIEADLEQVIVVGMDKDGMLYFAGSMSENERIIFLLEIAKKRVLDWVTP